MSNTFRSGASDFGILVNGVERVTVGDGGITLGAGRRLAQVVTFQTGAVATGTTILPYDNTIPQNTEGDQYMSLTITPTNASSTLEIDVSVNLANSSVTGLAMALFEDAVANALSAQSTYMLTSGGNAVIPLKHIMTAGTTSTKTFKVRAGSTGGTTTFNGSGGAQLLGGVMASRITIKEYLP